MLNENPKITQLNSKITQLNSKITQLNPEITQLNPKITQLASKITKLVFSGGGVRGYVYIGVLKYLEETLLLNQIEYVAGTSIGAFIATLVCLGFNSSELERIFCHFNYQNYQCIDF